MNWDPTRPTLTRPLALLLMRLYVPSADAGVTSRAASRPAYRVADDDTPTGFVMNVLIRISSHTRFAGSAPTISPHGCTSRNW